MSFYAAAKSLLGFGPTIADFGALLNRSPQIVVRISERINGIVQIRIGACRHPLWELVSPQTNTRAESDRTSRIQEAIDENPYGCSSSPRRDLADPEGDPADPASEGAIVLTPHYYREYSSRDLAARCYS